MTVQAVYTHIAVKLGLIIQLSDRRPRGDFRLARMNQLTRVCDTYYPSGGGIFR